ncbi:MAG TPA: hypothetical protein GX725_02650 [Mollicutes bacterium]|nr:hypothetical protein [Mollicutes bacterium]
MGNMKQVEKENVKQKRDDFLKRFVANVPNYLDSKNNISLLSHIREVLALVDQGATYTIDEDQTITISLSLDDKSLKVMGIGVLTKKIKEYKIKIFEDKVFIDRKENSITTNENYLSNASNYTSEVYSNSNQGVVREVFTSSRSNSFPNTRNVMDRCVVRELMVSHKYIFDDNWNIKNETINYGTQKEYEVDKRVEKFEMFASKPETHFSPYQQVIYASVPSKITNDNYVTCINVKNNEKNITLYQIPLQKESYANVVSNIAGKDLTLEEFNSLVSPYISKRIDPSLIMQEPHIK